MEPWLAGSGGEKKEKQKRDGCLDDSFLYLD